MLEILRELLGQGQGRARRLAKRAMGINEAPCDESLNSIPETKFTIYVN